MNSNSRLWNKYPIFSNDFNSGNDFREDVNNPLKHDFSCNYLTGIECVVADAFYPVFQWILHEMYALSENVAMLTLDCGVK